VVRAATGHVRSLFAGLRHRGRAERGILNRDLWYEMLGLREALCRCLQAVKESER